MLQESEMYRERERHLDFNSGQRVLIDDDNLYVSPAPNYQPNKMGSREQNRSMELDRQERERQRKADLQRRAELQRELEMERENLRRQKEEEDREQERQRKRESLERQREADRQRELELQREMERERQREVEREREHERERERQRQAEQERQRKRQMDQERERLHLQLEREQTEREIQRQQDIIREREMKIQQNYEQNDHRLQLEREKRAAMDHDQELHRMREMEMLREREAALEQEMPFRDSRMPPRQDIPSLLTMPKVAPSAHMKKGLLGDINDGLDDALMEKVRLQQAMLAQQTPSGSGNSKPNQNKSQNQSQNQNHNQNRQARNKRTQRRRGNQQQSDGNRNANKGPNRSQNQRQIRLRQNNNNKKQSGKEPGKASSGARIPVGPKTPPWLKEGAFDSSKSNKGNSSKVDLYDPLHPTEDDDVKQDGSVKRKHSEGELQVRIHQDNESRDVLDPPQKKHAGSKIEIPTSGDIQPFKEMLIHMRPKFSSSLEWICHVCNVKCHEVMNYHQHMMGKRHQAMMSHIMEVAEAKTTEALQTLRAEGHVDRIRRGFEYHHPSSKRTTQETYFCELCTTYIFISREEHNKSAEHKDAKKETERKCKICNKTFKSLSSLLTHCNTINHKMSFEVRQEQEKKDAVEKNKKYKEKLFVTVDEVGYEPDDVDKAVEKFDIEDKQKNGSTPETVLDSTDAPDHSKPTVAVDPAFPNLPVPGEPKDMTYPPVVPLPTPSDDLPPPSYEHTPEELKKDPLPWTMEDLVSYNPNSIVGQEYVIPVTGFFCKLCRKFYNSENSAKVIHCKSQAHFTNLKKLYEEMQLAAQLTKSKDVNTKEDEAQKEKVDDGKERREAGDDEDQSIKEGDVKEDKEDSTPSISSETKEDPSHKDEEEDVGKDINMEV